MEQEYIEESDEDMTDEEWEAYMQYLIDKAEALEAVHEADSLELAQHGTSRIAERLAALAPTDAAQAREAAMQELIDAYEDIINYGPLVLARKDQWKRVEAAKEKLKEART